MSQHAARPGFGGDPPVHPSRNQHQTPPPTNPSVACYASRRLFSLTPLVRRGQGACLRSAQHNCSMLSRRQPTRFGDPSLGRSRAGRCARMRPPSSLRSSVVAGAPQVRPAYPPRSPLHSARLRSDPDAPACLLHTRRGTPHYGAPRLTAVLSPLGISHQNLALSKVQVLDPHPQTFH